MGDVGNVGQKVCVKENFWDADDERELGGSQFSLYVSLLVADCLCCFSCWKTHTHTSTRVQPIWLLDAKMFDILNPQALCDQTSAQVKGGQRYH